eukprot:COSAG06_NODE_4408_length_4291_cov_570.385019_6_plen_433_part_00
MSLAKPDIMVNAGNIPSEQSIGTTTSILEPVVHTSTMCRFVLENKGRLHANSKIVLGVAATDQRAFFPPNVGIHCLISRVALKFGGKLISEIQDFNHFMSYKACFNSNEENFERNTVTNGILMDYQMIDDEVGIHTGRSYKGDAVLFEEFNDLKQIPTYQIRLVDMFPWLGKVQLPLYLMKEQVSIELFFETDNAKKYITPKGGTDIAGSISIDTEQTKLVADYIYYPQPIMDNYEAQIAKTGLTIPILEYGLVKMTVALVSDDVKILRNIGGANRMVTKLIIMNSETGKTRQVLFNDFGSSLVSKDGATFRYNIKYNDRNLYPRNIDNVAHAFNQVQNAEGLPLFITGGEYDVDRADYTTKKIEGYDLNIAAQTNTRGFVAIKLDGERVNSAGIEVDMALFDTNGDVVTRIYLEMGCILTLKDGKVNKTYA